MARVYTFPHGRETEGERSVYAFFSKLSNQFHFWHGVKIRVAGIHTEIRFENDAGLTDNQLQLINQAFNPAFIARPVTPMAFPAVEPELEIIRVLRDLVMHNDKLLQRMWRRS